MNIELINNLWTVYVAATFAAAGYGFSASLLSPNIAAAVTLGFLAFAIGNWKLLKQDFKLSALQKDISEFISPKPGCNPFAFFLDPVQLSELLNYASHLWRA